MAVLLRHFPSGFSYATCLFSGKLRSQQNENGELIAPVRCACISQFSILSISSDICLRICTDTDIKEEKEEKNGEIEKCRIANTKDFLYFLLSLLQLDF